MIESLEQLFRRMRWKAPFTLKPELAGKQGETYGFNSSSVPPACRELQQFEEMLELAANVRFDKVSNTFLDKLNSDVKSIKTLEQVIILF